MGTLKKAENKHGGKIMNTIDAYSHEDVDPRIFYSPTNVTNCEELIDFHCVCKESCQPNTCLCLQYNGHQLNYNNFKIVLKNSVFFECRKSCASPPGCGNKVVQNGPRSDLVIKDFGQKGTVFENHQKCPVFILFIN